MLSGGIGTPVTGERGKLAYGQSFNVGTRGLRIIRIGSVVADLWIRQHHDLPGIGRVREDLLISGDRGIEDYFACTFNGRTKTLSLEDSTVFQGEDCWVQKGFPPD